MHGFILLTDQFVMNNLNVEASLKLGLLAGLSSVEGSIKYLKQ